MASATIMNKNDHNDNIQISLQNITPGKECNSYSLNDSSSISISNPFFIPKDLSSEKSFLNESNHLENTSDKYNHENSYNTNFLEDILNFKEFTDSEKEWIKKIYSDIENVNSKNRQLCQKNLLLEPYTHFILNNPSVDLNKNRSNENLLNNDTYHGDDNFQNYPSSVDHVDDTSCHLPSSKKPKKNSPGTLSQQDETQNNSISTTDHIGNNHVDEQKKIRNFNEYNHYVSKGCLHTNKDKNNNQLKRRRSSVIHHDKDVSDKSESKALNRRHFICGIKRLIKQIEQVDKNYSPGIGKYVESARKILKNIITDDGFNSLLDYQFVETKEQNEQKKALERLSYDEEFMKIEDIGLSEMQYAAFVIIAGGLGERLGYSDIKLSLPNDVATLTTMIESHISCILQYETDIKKKSQDIDDQFHIPLIIMTSAETHDRTIELLKKYNFFGMKEESITCIKQISVPSIKDIQGNFATEKDDIFTLITKPHGHGDIHMLLSREKIVDRWILEGRKWVIFLQDTNTLAFRGYPYALGQSVLKNYDMNTIGIPRKPGEAIGALCSVKSKENRSFIINVEYNIIDSMYLKSFGRPEPVDENGYSYILGNTNLIILKLKPYHDTLLRTKGHVPEVLNPKFKNEEKKEFRSPVRLECLLQDIPLIYPSDTKIGVTGLHRWFCMTSVKNNVSDAAIKSRQNLNPESAFTGEADIYYANKRIIELASQGICESCKIGEPVKAEFLNIEYFLPPMIILSPSFGMTLREIRNRIGKGTNICITQRSTLIIHGNVILNGLNLDGALILDVHPGGRLIVNDVKVRNKGWTLRKVDTTSNTYSEISDYIKIRGYDIEKLETCHIKVADGEIRTIEGEI